MGRTLRENDLAQMIQRMGDRIDDLEQALRVQGYQTGDIKMFGGITQPDGWIVCDGRTVKRSEFPALNRVLSDAGYPFGNGDGSTTFHVPNFSGRVPLGATLAVGSATRATVHALGQTPTSNAGGEESHILTIAEMPSHSHSLQVDATSTTLSNNNRPTMKGTATTTVFSTDSQGGDGAHNIMQPHCAVNFYIKA